jgi:predicted nucleic acid-binding Zn ribbon protein
MPHAKGFRKRREGASAEPVPLGEVLEHLMADQLFARGMPVARLAAAWSDLVGERLASETAPASFEDGVLTVTATTGPWGAQARFLHEQIRRRADEALGGDVVRSVRVVVRNRR